MLTPDHPDLSDATHDRWGIPLDWPHHEDGTPDMAYVRLMGMMGPHPAIRRPPPPPVPPERISDDTRERIAASMLADPDWWRPVLAHVMRGGAA